MIRAIDMNIYKLAITTEDQMDGQHFAGLLSEVVAPSADAVSMFEHGAQWLVEGYFNGHENARNALQQLRGVNDKATLNVAIEEVGDCNWVAISQASLPPVHVARFTIFGSHDRLRIGSGPGKILIDAGEAFGTAHHATTFGCIEAIDRLTSRFVFKSILDLGTGSGVLALVLRRTLPEARILAVDSDPQAVQVARTNARINGDLSVMHGRLSFAEACGLKDRAIYKTQSFDLIVANIMADPLLKMSVDISSSLSIGGSVILSGILNEQAASIIACYKSHGLYLERRDRLEGWTTLTMKKR